MASNTTNSTFELQEKHGGGATNISQNLDKEINLLKKQIQEERLESIKEKVERNRINLQCYLAKAMLVISRNESLQGEENGLSSRMNHPLCTFNGFIPEVLGEGDHINNIPDVSIVKSIKIPYIKRSTPCTYWVDLLRKEYEEHGSTEEVSRSIKNAFEATSSKIQERCKNIKENGQHFEDYGENESHAEIYMNKSLSANLEIFDHLLCPKCLIFCCTLHKYPDQQIIYPKVKQPIWSEPEGDREPCGDHCYLYHKGKSSVSNWKLLEKELCLKGIEMFGRNSCRISQNLLLKFKTCKEVASYMYAEVPMPHGSMNENENVELTEPQQGNSKKKREE